MIMIWGEKVVSKERRSKTGRQSYEHFPPRGRHTKNERANEQLQLCAGRYAQEADIIHLASASCQTFLSVPLSLFVDDSQEKTSYVAHKHTFSTIRKSCSQLLHVWLRVYVSGCNSCCQVIVVVVTVCARRPKKKKNIHDALRISITKLAHLNIFRSQIFSLSIF